MLGPFLMLHGIQTRSQVLFCTPRRIGAQGLRPSALMNSGFSRVAVGSFDLFFRPWVRQRMRFRVTGLPIRLPANRPIFLTANHVSWWDLFALREVQRRLRPGVPLYTILSRAEVARFPAFGFMGAIGVDRDSTISTTQALRFLQRRLAWQPNSMVVFFPQGRIWPSHRRPLGFHRSVELFTDRLPALVIPVALHCEPLNTITPTLFVSLGEPLDGVLNAAGLESSVEKELDAIFDFLAVHGDAAIREWPGRYARLGSAFDRTSY